MFVLVPVTCIWCFTPVNLHHHSASLRREQVSSADIPLLGDWCWLRSFEWPLFQVFPHFPWSIHHPRSDNWDSFHFHGFWMCIHSHLTFYLRLHNVLVEICIILISSSETQATTKDFVSCFQCYSLHTLKPQCDQLGPISHHNAEMWQKSKTNVPCSRPVETHKTEVNCDIQLRRYWSQMTGSGHITVFIFLFFPSDFNDLWGSWWCRSMQWHLHPQRRHKMDRWRATSLPWGQVSRVNRDRIRQKPERESQWKGLQSKGEQKKREQSQRILPRSRIWIKVKASQKHTACENTVREGF